MSWFRDKSETTEHRYTQERLSAYMDEELSPGERGRMEHHLDGCPQCRCELDNLRRTVQWTMALPVVPCPRNFTVPVPAPAKRARVAQRVWGMPVLQGATALVAVLFLLAVVGEAFLPGMLPASAPAPAAIEREAAAVVEATQVVELQQESVQLMAAEAPSEAIQTSEPAVAEAAKLALDPTEDQAAAAASAAPPGMGVGGGSTDAAQAEATVEAPRGVAGVAAEGEPGTATPEVTPAREPSLTPTATVSPEPTVTPSPTATLVPTLALAPTLVAAANMEAGGVDLDQSEGTSEKVHDPRLWWLTVAEIALGAAFVALGTLTVILMVRRLRHS